MKLFLDIFYRPAYLRDITSLRSSRNHPIANKKKEAGQAEARLVEIVRRYRAAIIIGLSEVPKEWLRQSTSPKGSYGRAGWRIKVNSSELNLVVGAPVSDFR